MTSFKPETGLERSLIETWIQGHLAAWEARDAEAITAGFQAGACLIFPSGQWVGPNQVREGLTARLAAGQAIRLHVRRLLVDALHRAAAVEWVCRYAGHGEQDCREILGATVLDFNAEGQVWRWRAYLDPVRRRTLLDWDAPLPDEGWAPSPNPGPPPPRERLEQIGRANAAAWSSHDLTQLNALIHAEICIQPPWDYQSGRAAVEAAARIYFANYRDTQVTPHRFIIDPAQPYFGVCEQTFACTNPDTGRRGEDHDFAFFEVVEDKLRYWRTYFDTSHSAQVVEKTAGFILSG